MDLLEYFDKPFIYTHVIISTVNVFVFLYYFSSVHDKYRYFINGLYYVWIPLFNIMLLRDITGYNFLFSILHHLLLPCYFYAHQKILYLMNNDA
jgi:hypothetical protein